MACVLVRGLPDDVRERDLSDRFASFGRIGSIAVKFPPRAPPFCFIEYNEEKDAAVAVAEMDGRVFQGRRLRVEMPRASAGRATDASSQQSTQYRVRLSNLPPQMTRTELKKFLSAAGDVVHADVDRRGGGTASFVTLHEMKSAIRQLDLQELEGEGERVRIRDDRFPGGTSRTSSVASSSSHRSPPRSHGTTRSRSRSSSVSRDRFQSRTSRRTARSPSRSRSRSRSRSPSPRRYSRRRSRSRSRSH